MIYFFEYIFFYYGIIGMVIIVLSREELLKLDISKIRSNGRFVDVNIPKMFYLQDKEIAFLRRYYNDPNIAKDVNLDREEKRTYKVSREDKYTGYKPKKRVRKNGMIPVIMFGVLVFISVSFIAPKLKSNAVEKTYESSGIIYEEPTIQDIRDELERYETTVGSYDDVTERVEDLMYYCDIYQVDFNRVYNHLKSITNNFTSEDYLNNHHIKGVTCKGHEVYASSERELLLLYVRCCKQAPSNVGLSTEGLFINKDFEDSMNYYQNIRYCSDIFDVDPCLVYGIIMSESGLKSNLFLESNNPAGLRNPDNPEGFWEFSTPQEGIVETCLEVRKFIQNGRTTIEEIGKVYCPVGGWDDPNGLNSNWVTNVTNNTQYAREHFNEVFDIENYVKR
mgnify:CR=1 FL=1